MALPSRPTGGLPPRPPATPASLPALPDLGQPQNKPAVDPRYAPYVEQFRNRFHREPNISEMAKIVEFVTKKEAAVKPEPQTITPAPVLEIPQRSEPVAETTEDSEWRIDPKTGKRYKDLPGFKKGVMGSKATITRGAKGGFGADDLRTMLEDVPDFNMDDLNGTAEMFMAHLRVPPDKEEQKRLAAERAERQKAYDAIAKTFEDEEPLDEES